MAELLTIQDSIDGHLDTQTLKEAVNEDKIITARLGREYASVPMASRLLVENGLLGATPFSTYSAMTASALADGDYAIVTNDVDLSKNGVYQKIGGAWVYSEYNPIAQSQALIDTYVLPNDAADVSHNFTDKNGFVIASLLINGLFKTNGIDVAGDELWFERSPDNAINLLDKNGFVLASSAATKAQEQTSVITNQSPPELGYQIATDIVGVMTYGQSLSRGQAALPAISTTTTNNLTMASGVLRRPNEAGYSASDFAPLVESAIGTEGETPTSGMLNGASRRISEAGLPDYQFFGGSMGRGGSYVDELSKSSTSFDNLCDYVKDANAIAKSKNKSFSMWAMAWAQGENDNTSGSSNRLAYQYTQEWLANLWQPFKNFVLQTTGQQFLPYLITYQTPGHRRSSSDTIHIAKAQWRASREYDDVVMAVPAYIFPTAADNQHLTNEGSWLMGEYMGRALFYTMIQRQKWRPLEPVAVDWQDGFIDIEFYVPQGKLVLDAALAALYDNYGFVMRDAADAVIDIISAVTIANKNTVRITLSSAAPSGAVITYGRGKPSDPASSGNINGSRGNLRDTHGDTDKATSPLGNTFDLHNPCVYFEYSQKLGFAI
ncbi:hypothetical protein I3252_05535 [Psychrobacter sp. Ps4]|uniref:hypothetical protein n=1 Tax=Psychrobacter sp. Ps4 TaxID=2790958 RepID=UPI001EDE73BE|nr:hypothetical protein [Psychrobacter sp. Ps4]MCG3808946.1 hypothetical protein [Psychrobacter sp. Ps4]